MDQKILFQEALTSLVEFAATKGNYITPEEINLRMKEFITSDSQYPFIYDYLLANKITVEGYKNIKDSSAQNKKQTESTEKESTEESAFIEMYLSDISSIPPAENGEIEALLEKLLHGNTDVVNRLVECHLSMVADLAKNYRLKGVSFGDLIQEGNIGLMIGISDYNENCGDFSDFISKRICTAMEDIIQEQTHSDQIGTHLADKLNQLDHVTKQLNETLGRIPEISEISEMMAIPEEQVSLLLKLSLDTLSVSEDIPENK